MSDKNLRRMIIRRMLRDHEVSSQEQLVGLLAEEGFEITQATLSRDLRDMGVSRERHQDGIRYVLDHRARYIRALREVVGMEILDVRHNGFMVVIRTLSGRAEGVGAIVDGLGTPEILGTVAGDDTVFIAPRDPSRCDAVVALILRLAAGDEPLVGTEESEL